MLHGPVRTDDKVGDTRVGVGDGEFGIGADQFRRQAVIVQAGLFEFGDAFERFIDKRGRNGRLTVGIQLHGHRAERQRAEVTGNTEDTAITENDLARAHILADQHVRHGGDGLAVRADDIIADQVRGFEFASGHNISRARQDRFGQGRIVDGTVRHNAIGICRFRIGRAVHISSFSVGVGTGACGQGGHQGSGANGGNEVFHRMFLSLREHPLNARGVSKVPESACNFGHAELRGV